MLQPGNQRASEKVVEEGVHDGVEGGHTTG